MYAKLYLDEDFFVVEVRQTKYLFFSDSKKYYFDTLEKATEFLISFDDEVK